MNLKKNFPFNDLLGWSVPMPLPAEGSRRYDEVFWKELIGGGGKKSEAQNMKELDSNIWSSYEFRIFRLVCNCK